MSLASGVGLISGLNFNDIITQLIAVSARPIGTLKAKQSVFRTRQSALQIINKSLLDLKATLGSLDAESDFNRRSVSVGEPDTASVSVTSTAAEGSFTLKVQQLAQADRLAAQGIDTDDETAIASGTGSFSFQVGDGDISTINVTSTTTLVQLRDAINSDAASGIRASIINDGTATNPYRIVLTTTATGADNTLTILTNDTTLNFATKSIEAAAADSDNTFDGTVTSSGTYTGSGTSNFVVKVTTGGALETAKFQVSTDGGLTFGAVDAFTASATPVDIGDGVEIGFTAGTVDFAVGDIFTIDAFDPRLQTAQDAVVEIDGLQIRRSTNTISDAIDGVTITAKQVDATGMTVTVTNDDTNATGQIAAFVTAYNALIATIENVASFDAETKVRGPLFADSGVRSIRSTITNIASSAIAGLSGTNSLGLIGITIGSDGRLTIDLTKLNAAIEDDFVAVKRIFALIGTSTSSGIAFDDLTEATRSGSYGVSIGTAATRASVLGNQAVDAGGITNAETLTFTIGGKPTSIIVGAGSTLAATISRLNDAFSDEGLLLEASDDGGRLKIETTDYGSDAKFSIISDQSGGDGTQLGIGTSQQDLAGVDVAGTIDGFAATGKGQFLTGQDGTPAEGLSLLITSASPVDGTVTVSRGIAERILKRIGEITDESDGLIKTKTDTLNDSIEDISDQITRIRDRLGREETRLRRQFTNLELKLSTLTIQGNFLLSQLASIPLIGQRNR